jgi:hypothetical protein
VNNKKAKPARSIEEIRDTLGVRAADNLRHAEIVLLVEGQDDRLALSAILAFLSSKLKAAMEASTLAIDSLGGGFNLGYKAGLIRDQLSACHCFMDHDRAGRESVSKAKLGGLLKDADVNFSIVLGMSDSELEDCYEPDFYAELISRTYRVSLQAPSFRSNRKWSERMKNTFMHQGKGWDDTVESKVKQQISELVAANPEQALNQHKRNSLDALTTTLEQRLGELP